MKILWLTPSVIPQVAKEFNLEYSVSGSWMIKLFDEISKVHGMTVVFPQNFSKEIVNVKVGENSYYGFYEDNKHYERYDSSRESIFKKIIDEEKPDIVHIWGTEFIFSYAMVKAFNNPNRTLVNIQGVMGDYAKSYFADLPTNVVNSWTVRDFLRRDNIRRQKTKYEQRSKYEKLVFDNVKNFVGRTDWDHAITNTYNQNANYYHCNEILRTEFYENKGKWDIAGCMRHTIFISQWYFPIKGIHKVLDALIILRKKFPDIKVYIAGSDFKRNIFDKPFFRYSSYEKYIKKIIEKNNLEENVVSLGKLSADGMVEYMLKSNVFVSASSVENESNSLSEAKMLGLPCVVSVAGGTSRRINHGVDGFQYQYEKEFMLAYYIEKIFEDDELAANLGRNAVISANEVNDVEKNTDRMLEIYDIVGL